MIKDELIEELKNVLKQCDSYLVISPSNAHKYLKIKLETMRLLNYLINED